MKIFDLTNFKKNDLSILKFSSKINLKIIREEFNLEIKTKTQNKSLDLLIKVKNRIFLCEAKHLNTSGGGQDKQISELIELVSLKEVNKNVYFISFLDGKYSNVILNDLLKSPKITTQRNQILESLRSNKNSFWVNTKGFEAIFTNAINLD